MTVVREAGEWEKREQALLGRLLPYLQRQPGFVSHELRREDDAGQMIEVTRWQSMDDCRAYLRNGAAAMAATWLDAFFPTAAYPNGNWVRETAEA
jgi:heme-degrading monooxygenase HmoA